MFEGGYDVDEDSGDREGGRGVDTTRMNIVLLLTSLNLCEPVAKVNIDFPNPVVQSDDDPRAVSEDKAEDYHLTVTAIDENGDKCAKRKWK